MTDVMEVSIWEVIFIPTQDLDPARILRTFVVRYLNTHILHFCTPGYLINSIYSVHIHTPRIKLTLVSLGITCVKRFNLGVICEGG